MSLYKVLDVQGRACNGGHDQWSLPRKEGDSWIPGEWMPEISDPIPCERGYHLCRRSDLIGWLGPAIWIAETRGVIVEDTDKIVAAQARLLEPLLAWTDRAARLFAADCAEHVLFLYEKVYPKDHRPRKSIEAARQYTRGEIDGAARDAAWDAARAAASAAASAAARAAASAAARAAARDAVWDAEYSWQTDRLFLYLDGILS